jgi:hypothetical protein
VLHASEPLAATGSTSVGRSHPRLQAGVRSIVPRARLTSSWPIPVARLGRRPHRGQGSGPQESPGRPGRPVTVRVRRGRPPKNASVRVGPKRASTPSAAPVPPNGARGAASPRLPGSCRPSGKQAAWTSTESGLDDLHALRLRTGTMWPADSGRTAPGSMIGRRGGTGEAVSGPSGKSPDDAGEPEWGLTCLDRTDTRRIPENPR